MNETLRFYQNLLPFGSNDVQSCISTLNEAGVEFSDFAEYVEEYTKSVGVNLIGIDVCAIAYEYILNQAREEIKEATGKDILNDIRPSVYVYGNYSATDFDQTSEELTELVASIPEEDKSELLKYFESEIN